VYLYSCNEHMLAFECWSIGRLVRPSLLGVQRRMSSLAWGMGKAAEGVLLTIMVSAPPRYIGGCLSRSRTDWSSFPKKLASEMFQY
jgi:hypothetical protein